MNSTAEHLKNLDNDGFTVLPNLFSHDECEYFKVMIEQHYRHYSPHYVSTDLSHAGSLANKAGEKVVYNLHNKHIDWFRFFEHPAVLPILDIILKEGSYKGEEPYYLYNISARCPLKGFPGQQLHGDSNLPGINYCIVANVLWALDEFTLENGATRVVPRSHKIRQFPLDGVRHPDEIRLTAPQGSAIIFNANLWHGGAENTTDSSRWALALGYARWFVKPSFDYMRNTPNEIYSQMTNDQKKLLGFHLFPSRDEFTRLRRRSETPEQPFAYLFPALNKE